MRMKISPFLAALLLMALVAACQINDPLASPSVSPPDQTTDGTADTPARTSRPDPNTEYDYSHFKFQDVAGGLSVFLYNGNWSDVAIPPVFDGYDVVEIASGAFENNKSIEKVTIPDSVKIIGDHAFDGCSRLTSVIMGNGVGEIRTYAFANTPALAEVKLSDALKTVGAYAFFNGFSAPVNKLETIRIPAGVTEIGPLAFSANGLKSVTIPGNVKTVGDGAFCLCKNLVTVTIENGVETLGDGLFAHCDALRTIYMPASLKKIGKNLLNGTVNSAVIIAPGGSAAEAYAQENEIECRNS